MRLSSTASNPGKRHTALGPLPCSARFFLVPKALSFRGFELPIGGHGGLGSGGGDRSRGRSEGPDTWISGAQVLRTDSLRETAPGSAHRVLVGLFFHYKSRLHGEVYLLLAFYLFLLPDVVTQRCDLGCLLSVLVGLSNQ